MPCVCIKSLNSYISFIIYLTYINFTSFYIYRLSDSHPHLIFRHLHFIGNEFIKLSKVKRLKIIRNDWKL